MEANNCQLVKSIIPINSGNYASEKVDKVRTDVVIVNAEIAHELLKSNIRNRSVHQKTVDQYARIMKKGEWKENYDPIQISDGGVLLNGQHRLMAIVKSKRPQKMLIIRGVNDDAKSSYDRGKVRTVGDILSLDGIPNSKYVASISKAYVTLCKSNVMSLSNGTMSGSANKSLGLTDTDYTDIYIRHGKEIQQSLFDAKEIYKKLKGMFTVSELAGYIMYLIVEKHHPQEKVKDFFDKLHQLNYSENNVINLLRERLVATKMSGYNLTSKAKKALVVKSWNAWITGKEIKRLIWNEQKDAMPEFI